MRGRRSRTKLDSLVDTGVIAALYGASQAGVGIDRRVEVLVPLSSESVRERIRQECLALLDLDNCRVYEMDSSGTYRRRRPTEGQTAVDSQLVASSPPARRFPSSPEGPPSPRRVLGPASLRVSQARA